MEILYLVLGLMLGGVAAVVIMSSLFIAGDADYEQEVLNRYLNIRSN